MPLVGARSGTPVTKDRYDTYAGAATNASTAGIDGNNEVNAWRKDDSASVSDFDSLAIDDFDAPVIYKNEQISQEFQLLYQSDWLNGAFNFMHASIPAKARRLYRCRLACLC